MMQFECACSLGWIIIWHRTALMRLHQCDGISSMASVRLLACVSVQVGTALIPLASVLASAGTALM